MRKIKEPLTINPLLITYGTIFLLYIILAIFNPFDSLTTLTIFVLITLMSYSIANIIFSITPGTLSVSERIISIMHSFIMFLLTTVSITLSMEKPMFSIEVVMSFLIFSFFIIGGFYFLLGLINTGFPKWFRRSNLIFGSFTIGLSLIALIFPLSGYLLLSIIITALMIIKKTLGSYSSS